MNFFSRRKILKQTNYLDLTPVRLLKHELRDDGGVDVLLPRFRNTAMSRMFQPGRKDTVIRIHLDPSGSLTWIAADGHRNVGTICRHLLDEHAEQMKPVEEIERRVTDFLSLLYRERYITFREISPDETSHPE